ncbi:glycosyltransferase family 4 protein [bacterium]|nr:glycosyltransferase family 4 protein [bacterium]
MKKVLILAYYFPPLGMGGTQRAAKFTKYLPNYDWQPVVITVKEIAYFAKDRSLLNDVTHATVVRTGSLDPQRLLWLWGRSSETSRHSKVAQSTILQAINRLLHWILIPDSKLLWLPFLLMRAISVARHERIDCLFVTSPPHSAQLAGILLKRICGIPLVVDFRDGWSRGNFQAELTKFHSWINRRLERWVLKQADQVITVSNKLREELTSRLRVARHKFQTITNGYDVEDFLLITSPKKNSDRFRILYCGTLSRIAPVESFLTAFSELVAEQPDLRSEIAVEFVGYNLEADWGDRIPELELDDVVILSGYQEYISALEKLMAADLLLYPIAEWASSDFIPGKTFEYVASGIPILAIGPKVEGASILEAHSEVVSVDHADTAGIKDAIFQRVSAHKKTVSVKRPLNRHSDLERMCLTKKLADVFDGLT